jgi:DNA repair protein RadC
MNTFRISEKTQKYLTKRGGVSEEELLQFAKTVIRQKFLRNAVLKNPDDTRDYLIHELSLCEAEVFCCLFLDSRHRVIAFEPLFNGTINGASVHPREVVKKVLAHNAAAVIFAHNHPSGVPEPSQADIQLTNRLKDILNVIDVRTLDHFVIGAGEAVSFAERGLV